MVQTQIVTRSKERLASEFIWEKRCVEEEEAEEEEQTKEGRKECGRRPESDTQNYQGRPGQKYPARPDSASVD